MKKLKFENILSSEITFRKNSPVTIELKVIMKTKELKKIKIEWNNLVYINIPSNIGGRIISYKKYKIAITSVYLDDKSIGNDFIIVTIEGYLFY